MFVIPSLLTLSTINMSNREISVYSWDDGLEYDISEVKCELDISDNEKEILGSLRSLTGKIMEQSRYDNVGDAIITLGEVTDIVYQGLNMKYPKKEVAGILDVLTEFY